MMGDMILQLVDLVCSASYAVKRLGLRNVQLDRIVKGHQQGGGNNGYYFEE